MRREEGSRVWPGRGVMGRRKEGGRRAELSWKTCHGVPCAMLVVLCLSLSVGVWELSMQREKEHTKHYLLPKAS